MTTFILPPLKDDHSVPVLDEPGVWKPAGEYHLLQRIGQGLKLAKLTPSIEELVSIPDAWAQVEVFRQAIEDEKHPLHESAVAEWRGLLGLFALAPYFSYSLATKTFRFADLVSAPFQAGRGASARAVRQSFATVLDEITPIARLCEGHSWNNLGVIFASDVPVGLMVPTTIVCPGRGYSERLAIDAPWLEGGKLCDPTRTADLRGEQLLSLEYFARNLRSRIFAHIRR